MIKYLTKQGVFKEFTKQAENFISQGWVIVPNNNYATPDQIIVVNFLKNDTFCRLVLERKTTKFEIKINGGFSFIGKPIYRALVLFYDLNSNSSYENFHSYTESSSSNELFVFFALGENSDKYVNCFHWAKKALQERFDRRMERTIVPKYYKFNAGEKTLSIVKKRTGYKRVKLEDIECVKHYYKNKNMRYEVCVRGKPSLNLF